MKKIFFVFFIFIGSSAAVFAQMPAAMPGPAASPAGLERVGVIAAAGGGVELTTPGQVGRVAESGKPVFLGDEVKTDEKGHLQVLLLDQTVFTIGPNSKLVIDEYVFDPKTSNGTIKASIAKGVFRYVSGKIAAKKADSVSVKLPTATIGFRGTIVGGMVNPDGSGLAALLGPGSNNNAGETIGSFIIQGTGGSHEVNRTGFGVQFGANGSLSGIFQLTGIQIYNLATGLLPAGGNGGGGGGLMGGSATNTSGQGTFLTGQNGGDSNSLGNLIGGNNALSIEGAQDEANASTGIADGTTLMSQLSRITTGIFHYNTSGTFNSSGSMTAKIDIDFGSRTIGGGDSYVYVSDVGYSDTTSGIAAQSFGSSGNAVFNWSNIEGSMGTFDAIGVTLKNSNGIVANQATVTTEYSSESMLSGSGSASGPRVEGATPSEPK